MTLAVEHDVKQQINLNLNISLYIAYMSFRGNIRERGGVAVRDLASNLWGRRFESRAGHFMLESW